MNSNDEQWRSPRFRRLVCLAFFMGGVFVDMGVRLFDQWLGGG